MSIADNILLQQVEQYLRMDSGNNGIGGQLRFGFQKHTGHPAIGKRYFFNAVIEDKDSAQFPKTAHKNVRHFAAVFSEFPGRK